MIITLEERKSIMKYKSQLMYLLEHNEVNYTDSDIYRIEREISYMDFKLKEYGVYKICVKIKETGKAHVFATYKDCEEFTGIDTGILKKFLHEIGEYKTSRLTVKPIASRSIEYKRACL